MGFYHKWHHFWRVQKKKQQYTTNPYGFIAGFSGALWPKKRLGASAPTSQGVPRSPRRHLLSPQHAQSTTAPPLRSFLKFSQSLRRPPTVATWLKGQSTDWLNLPSPTWSEKVHLHLPLGGDLREGSRS